MNFHTFTAPVVAAAAALAVVAIPTQPAHARCGDGYHAPPGFNYCVPINPSASMQKILLFLTLVGVAIIPLKVIAQEVFNATCIYNSTERMTCYVDFNHGGHIRWADGVAENYNDLGNGYFRDARGGIWKAYSAMGRNRLVNEANGNEIIIRFE